MGTLENEFVPPPECPVFEPTNEEFKDPLGYIAKIRSQAERYGICKIKPPSHWQPPFAVDIQNFKFTPRVQKINELEAQTRIKLNFLDKIYKFWTLQGSVLKIPHVEKKILDLYSLHKHVQKEGGYDQCVKDRKWTRIALAIGYPFSKNIGSHLRHHYQRLLKPYDDCKLGINGDVKKLETEDGDKKDEDYVPHGIASRQAIQPPTDSSSSRRSKRCQDSNAESIDYSSNNELRKLQFYGAGPKMPGYRSNEMDEKKVEDAAVCKVCFKTNLTMLMTCLKCYDSYHFGCLKPALTEVPKGVWRCPKCVAEEVSKPTDAFGFEQAQQEYHLHEFGEMADRFKFEYFQKEPHLVPTSEVEREFWKIVSSVDMNVSVQYGADLHTVDHGSGFPTRSSLNLTEEEREYAEAGWNLNNLPNLEGSVLQHIKTDISGMKVPWMYVGMCFATFCWHNEDHWSYSINYLHWGEPKTWYGVPGPCAEKFEEAMKRAAPELFETQPDLLHQLVTIMNPNILMNAGVPVVRTNQLPGEFVITFPRSYHAGFNQGYNFAEAVNFAPSDWLSIGRACVSHYSLLHRFCVFAHDELVSSMAEEADELDVSLAAATYTDMLKMVQIEIRDRQELANCGVNKAEKELFENLIDDERQCDFCKTTCFSSAISCHCSPKKIVCLPHRTKLCSCPSESLTFKFRYNLDELHRMLLALKTRAESFDKWAAQTEALLKRGKECDQKLLEALIEEAHKKKFPKNDYETKLNKLLANEFFVRALPSSEEPIKTVSPLRQVNISDNNINLPIKCEDEFTQLFESVIEDPLAAGASYLNEVLAFGLNQKSPVPTCFKMIKQLENIIPQVEWAETVKITLSKKCTYVAASALLEKSKGYEENVIGDVKKVLSDALKNSLELDTKAKVLLTSFSKSAKSLNYFNTIKKECSKSSIQPTSTNQIIETIKRTEEILTEIKTFQRSTQPCVEKLKRLVRKAQALPVNIEALDTHVNKLRLYEEWVKKATQVFLKSDCSLTLCDVLSPQKDFKKNEVCLFDFQKKNFVSEYKSACKREVEMLRDLRFEIETKIQGNYGDVEYCICSKARSSQMLECQLCKNWYHVECALAPAAAAKKIQELEGNAVLSLNPSATKKFLCSRCCRTLRPSLTEIELLVKEMNDLNLKFPEGQVLVELQNRVMDWRARVHEYFTSSEVAIHIESLRKVNFNVENANTAGGLGFSTTMFQQLNQLAIEGDLLECTLEEWSQLWSVQLASQPLDLSTYNKVVPFSPPPSPPNNPKKRKSLNEKISQKIKSKGLKKVCLNGAAPESNGTDQEENHTTISQSKSQPELVTCLGSCNRLINSSSTNPCPECSQLVEQRPSAFNFIRSLKVSEPMDL